MKFDKNGIVSFAGYIHVGYWLGIILAWIIFALLFLGEVYEPLINKLGYLPAQLIVTYSFLYLLLAYLLNRQYVKFFMGISLITYISLVVARVMKIYFTETLIGFESEKEGLGEILTHLNPLLAQYLIWVLMTPALTIIIVMILNHYYHGERIARLKNKKQEAELRFLKSQLHPHFLFNTLNNLYTLSLSNSVETARVAQRLYEILDFMFHQKGQNLVLLKDEMNLLNNYIELEKLRYGDRLKINVVISIDDQQNKIIPLVLLSIVENAFKHGASSDLNKPTIDIQLTVKNGQLEFIVENSKPSKISKDRQGYKNGIGVTNIKRQLELMYPNGYAYSVVEESSSYKVELSLDLMNRNTRDDYNFNPHTLMLI